MSTVNTSSLRKRLEEERDELSRELSKHGKKVGDRPDNWTGTGDELQVDSADRNEVADQIEELVGNIRIVESLEEQYRDAVHALEKIENGTYGTCEVCNKHIPVERLEANPAARACIEHAAH